MRKLILAALVAGTVATPALAQDTSLSGFRLEGLVGYETTDVEDEGADGVAYGVGVGYDVLSGGAVLGLEAEAMESGIKECVNGVDLPNDRLCVRGGRDLYVGGRVGAMIGANSLAYIKGGYTNARLQLDYRSGLIGTDARTFDNLDGVRVGGGVQFGLGPNLYAKAEYRYSNYEQGFDKHQGVAGLGFRF
jgi:outer membrane immunogenic protein